jgi:hypothetical protein
MLDAFKRWFAKGRSSPEGHRALESWAASRGHAFRGVRQGEGFIVEGRAGGTPWRLEWGPSQRSYVKGMELRMRAELGLHRELQALVMTRPLAEAMEKAVFDEYVGGVQTRIDTETPPEVRWLVMFPKLGSAELKGLRERYVALVSIKPWMLQWLDGPLPTALARAPLGDGPQAADSRPLVLMIGRGRLTLRTALDEPDTAVLDTWIRLFETALREVARGGDPGPDATPHASTQPGSFTATGGSESPH